MNFVMRMELRDIEYFAVVAACGNVRRAAEELGLSQPALSKSLRRLEKAVGEKLVQRTPKGVDLTAVGVALFARVHGLRLTLDDIAREAADLSQGRAGHLRIGTGARFSIDLIPAACAALLEEAPAVTLSISVGSIDMLAPAVSQGEMDLGVTSNSLAGYSGLVLEHLSDDEVAVYASSKHRLAKKKQVSLIDLAQEHWAVAKASPSLERLHRTFAENGLPPPKITVEENAVLFRRSILPMTDLVGFGPRTFFRACDKSKHLVELPVKGLSGRQSTHVFYREGAYLSPITRRFVEILKMTAKKMPKSI